MCFARQNYIFRTDKQKKKLKKKKENSRSVSRVLCLGRKRMRNLLSTKVSVINLGGCIAALLSRSLPSRLDEQPSGAGLHEIATRSVAVSSSLRMPFVAVLGTKHHCLPAVNRYVALCCPDFPLAGKMFSEKHVSPSSDRPTCCFLFIDAAKVLQTFHSAIGLHFSSSVSRDCAAACSIAISSTATKHN